jgi:hypothetical protein
MKKAVFPVKDKFPVRKIFYLFLLCLLPSQSFEQNCYYSGNRVKSVGVKIADQGDRLNSQICKVKKGKKELQLTPYDIDEYGFRDGRTYYSKNIHVSDSVQRVFLLQLSKGNNNLYYLQEKHRKTFFLEKDSSALFELPENKDAKDSSYFRNQLVNITADCPEVSDAVKLVSYNKKSMGKLFRRYNDCELKPFPFLKFGLQAGYGWTILDPSATGLSDLNEIIFDYEGRYVMGLFIDMPILMSDFSTHLEITYNKYGFAYNEIIDNRDIDFVANVSTLGLPLLVRYSYPSNKIRPFVNAGGYLSYSLKNENNLYEATVDHYHVEIAEIKENSLISDFMGGVAAGGGIEYKLNFRRSVFIDFRYYRLYGITDKYSMVLSEFLITSGINL